MKITVKRTGGYAGLDETKSVDTKQMDPGSAKQIEQLVGSLNFFGLASETGAVVGADLIHYQITIDDQGRRHTVGFDDDGSQHELRQLADLVVS